METSLKALPPIVWPKISRSPNAPRWGVKQKTPASHGLLPEVTGAQERLARAATINSTNRQGL